VKPIGSILKLAHDWAIIRPQGRLFYAADFTHSGFEKDKRNFKTLPKRARADIYYKKMDMGTW
jgi:hypothetical protein